MESRYSPSQFHLTQISRAADFGNTPIPEEIHADNQDRILAEMVAGQVRLLRAQRSNYLPEPLPFAPIVIVR